MHQWSGGSLLQKRLDERGSDSRLDHLIHCFKEGEPCASGRELLAQTRQGELAEVGEGEEEENDEEEEFNNELVVEDDDDEEDDDEE